MNPNDEHMSNGLILAHIELYITTQHMDPFTQRHKLVHNVGFQRLKCCILAKTL